MRGHQWKCHGQQLIQGKYGEVYEGVYRDVYGEGYDDVDEGEYEEYVIKEFINLKMWFFVCVCLPVMIFVIGFSKGKQAMIKISKMATRVPK